MKYFFLNIAFSLIILLQIINANNLLTNVVYTAAPKPLSFLEGLNYCLGLNARVLSIDELHWLYNNTSLSSNFRKASYWSGSFEELQSAYVLDFKTGLIFMDFQNNRHLVMCIKTK